MSRTRVRISPKSTYVMEYARRNPDSTYESKMECGPTYFYDVGGTQAYYPQYSVITDQMPSLLMAEVLWKNVEHTTRKPGRGSDVKWDFSPPTPPAITCFDWAPSPNPTTTSIDWSQYIDDLAIQLEKGCNSSFQAMVFIAEARKTWQMIRNPLSFLKPNWKRAIKKHTARTLANTGTSLWLGYRYGWTPLYKDVEAFSQMTATLLNRSYLPRSLERFSSGGTSVSTLNNLPGSCSYGDFQEWVRLPPANWGSESGFLFYIKQRNIKVSARILGYTFDPIQRITSLLERFVVASGATLTWRNIRDLCWEVLPFSFVIDWFVNFSDIWRPFNEQLILSKTSNRVGYSVKTEIQDHYLAVCPKPKICSRGNTIWRGNMPVNLTSPTFENFGGSCSYVRYAGLPVGSTGIFKQRGLSLLHGLDGLSLILNDLSRAKH